MKRWVKVTSVTYVPAYTPEDYLQWRNLNNDMGNLVIRLPTSPEPNPSVFIPKTIEECVQHEEMLLNTPNSELDLELYTETAEQPPVVKLELMPKGFKVENKKCNIRSEGPTPPQ